MLNSPTTWFAVTDSERMRIYTFQKNDRGDNHLVLIEEKLHPQSALKTSELVSDDEGRFIVT